MSLRLARTQFIYRFGGREAEGDGSMREELGGKGAGLAEMTKLGVPVPPGFTISTDACRFFLEHGRTPKTLDAELESAIAWLELEQARRFGGKKNPLLVSVRSGAAVSMPGMMDTILNVGINDTNISSLAARHQNLRFALDSYQRLLQMFGSVVLHVPKQAFDLATKESQQVRDPSLDPNGGALEPDDGEPALRQRIASFLALIERHTGEAFPMDPRIQLKKAIDAVFTSWNSERARHYRRIHKIPEHSGTAVTVQAMVFGNRGPQSGTGVGFTRNPSTGAHELFGEFLTNAQGEDIVAGIRTPMPIAELERIMPTVYQQLRAVTSKLESHYRDVQDFEFTVENSDLLLLQTRSAKRSALATIRTAVEMAEEGLISRADALRRVQPANIETISSRQLDLSSTDLEPIARGLPASPGSAVGRVALSANRAVELAGKRKESPIILVRQETTAEDIHGMDAAVGFLTATGGATSHAAVVARGMGKCCITGAGAIVVEEAEGVARIGQHTLREGDWLSLDGATGRVFLGRLPLSTEASAANLSLAKLLAWARETGSVAVHANADTPQDAVRARAAQAAGIGLCRTEHMFFAPDRLPHVRSMILASTLDARQRVLEALLPMQQDDFEELFRAMSGLPVTIRLIDPPLHEFLPTEIVVKEELRQARQHGGAPEHLAQLEVLLARVQELSESNPMLGLRGCRLAIVYPEILVMQITAILQAALKIQAEGLSPLPEIMIPLVASVEEIDYLDRLIEETAEAVFLREGHRIAYRVGAMVELPRAAICAGTIAKAVDFLSFGTNDLTQMTFGFSRDDARKYLEAYLELGILKDDPFMTIDREGVGSLIRSAILQARAVNPKVKIGVCGEHGGDPASIGFFAEIGVDYVSCSPARIAVAQLSAARIFPSTAPADAPADEYPAMCAARR